MNQPRRTFLQSLLALIGLGAAKAVAKSEAVAVPLKVQKRTWYVVDEMVKTQFDAAIGVVKRGDKLWISYINLNDKLPARMRRHDYSPEDNAGLTADDFSSWACRSNLMIFAQPNGADDAQLVAELMKRCPERVWHGNMVKPGVLTFEGQSIEGLLNRTSGLLESNGWATDDSDQAMALALAIFGTTKLR